MFVELTMLIWLVTGTYLWKFRSRAENSVNQVFEHSKGCSYSSSFNKHIALSFFYCVLPLKVSPHPDLRNHLIQVCHCCDVTDVSLTLSCPCKPPCGPNWTSKLSQLELFVLILEGLVLELQCNTWRTNLAVPTSNLHERLFSILITSWTNKFPPCTMNWLGFKLNQVHLENRLPRGIWATVKGSRMTCKPPPFALGTLWNQFWRDRERYRH